MTQENLTFYEPTEQQLAKFNEINALSDSTWERRCVDYNNCSICPMAIHQYLLSRTKHTCTHGLSEMEFRLIMSSADCDF